jgi:hypothetical protein
MSTPQGPWDIPLPPGVEQYSIGAADWIGIMAGVVIVTVWWFAFRRAINKEFTRYKRVRW